MHTLTVLDMTSLCLEWKEDLMCYLLATAKNWPLGLRRGLTLPALGFSVWAKSKTADPSASAQESFYSSIQKNWLTKLRLSTNRIYSHWMRPSGKESLYCSSKIYTNDNLSLTTSHISLSLWTDFYSCVTKPNARGLLLCWESKMEQSLVL